MSATTLPPSLNSHEQSLVQYRSISKWSLVALGLGLASALALVSLLLTPIPLLAVAIAIFSLRSIRASGGQVVGRAPAIVGLCLATFFLGWAFAARFSRALTLESHGRTFVEAWLQLVAEGDLQLADQFRVPERQRLRSVAGRKELYEGNPDARSGLTTFFATPVLRDYIAQGKEVKFRFAGVVSSERGLYFDRLTLRYTFSDASPSMLITIKRDLISEDETDWQIENVQGEAGP